MEFGNSKIILRAFYAFFAENVNADEYSENNFHRLCPTYRVKVTDRDGMKPCIFGALKTASHIGLKLYREWLIWTIQFK